MSVGDVGLLNAHGVLKREYEMNAGKRGTGTSHVCLLMLAAFAFVCRGADIVSSGANSEVFEVNGFYLGSDLTVGTSASMGSLSIYNEGVSVMLSNLTINSMGTVSLYTNSSLYLYQSFTSSGVLNWNGGSISFSGDTWAQSLSVENGTLYLSETSMLDESALINVAAGGSFQTANSSAVVSGQSLAIEGGEVGFAGTLQGNPHSFSSGTLYVGGIWDAGNYLTSLGGTGTVDLNGGALYCSDVINSDFYFSRGALHLQGGTHDTVYRLEEYSSYSKDLYIETGATVQTDENLANISDAQTIHVDGGTLTVTNTSLDGEQVEISSGTLNISSTMITGGGFLEMNGGTVNLSGYVPSTVTNVSINAGTLNIGASGFWAAGGDSLGNIGENAQVVLNGGTIYASLLDAGQFEWIAGEVQLTGATVSGDLAVNGKLSVAGDTVITGGLALSAEDELWMSAATLLVQGSTLLDGGTLGISLSGASITNGVVLDLFDWAGGINGTFDTVSIWIDGVQVDETQWDLSALYTGGTIQAVPEPATLLLLLFGGGLAWISHFYRRF